MKRFKSDPISTILGLAFIVMAFVLLWKETNYDIPLFVLGLMVLFGLLLIEAKDKFLDILTLGLSRFIQDKVVKK